MATSYKDYSPGSGSYKVEESGTIKGISTPGNVCAQMGGLTLSHAAFDFSARGLNLSLKAKFNSDHLYSTVISKISKGEKPVGTLMTLPDGQSNFYRICNGWSWDLPKVIIGEKNVFQVVINGKTFILDSVITDEAYNSGDDSPPETWAEGYHIKYGAETSGRRPLTVAIPEAKVIITCTVEKTGTFPFCDYRVIHENDTSYPFRLHLADGSVVKFFPSYLIDGNGTRHANAYADRQLKDSAGIDWTTCVQEEYWAYNATDNTRARVTNVAPHVLDLDENAFNDGTEVYYIFPANAGLVERITAPDGINSLRFFYNDLGISGKVTAQGNPARKQFALNSLDYMNLRVGDLITIKDETRVIWTKDGNNKVTVSSGFSFTPTTSDFYHVSQGTLKRIEHADGRCVKFYYYSYDAGDGFGILPRLTTVLSSNTDMSVLETTDLFLIRYSFYAIGLRRIEALDDMPRAAQVDNFDTGQSNALGSGINKDEDRFRVLQYNQYDYNITSDPDQMTNFITVTSRSGAFTKYLFQKGGFSTQTFSDLATYTGRIKAKSTASVLSIEKPDFLLGTNYWINTSRILVFADLESSVKKRDSSGEPVSYKAVSRFSKVSALPASGRIKLANPLTAPPEEGDVFLAIQNAGTLSTASINKNSAPDNARRVYTNVALATTDDLIAIRNEVRKIVAVGTDYFDVDREFSFLPTHDGGTDLCAFIPKGSDNDFCVYYLNKPKVVKIEERRSVDATEWKSTSYAYEYLKGGNETIDDINGGGFIFDDTDGPAESQLRPDSIELTKTTITVWKEGPSKSEDFTQTIISFDYDENKVIKGEKDTKHFRREGDTWVPISMTVQINGNPCTNATYYGVTSSYTYRNTSQHESREGVPTDAAWKERTDFDYDAWGRMVRSRKYSPSFPGGQAMVNWTQYVGIGTLTETNLDPYSKFNGNPYTPTYQALYNSKLCFELVGATVAKINKDDLELLVCKNFDAALNPLEIREYERTSLSADDLKYKGVTFRTLTRKIIDGNGTKTADARTVNHLKDADGTNWAGVVNIGDLVTNITGGKKVRVTAIAAHDLTLDSDAFPLGNGTEKYWIHADTVTIDQAGNYWRLYKIGFPNQQEGTNSNNWDNSRFGLPTSTYGERVLITSLTWDGATNVLIKVTKPEGNEINLAYGSEWKSSQIVRDYVELDGNLGGTSQYIVNAYDYDLKGRMIQKVSRLKTDTADSDTNQYDSTKYPHQTSQFSFDGMDRVILKNAGGDPIVPVLRQAYDDFNRVVIATDFLGFVNRSTFDEFYRASETQSFKPNQATDIELSNLVAFPENLTSAIWAATNASATLVESYSEARRFTRVSANAVDGYIEQTVDFNGDGAKSIQGTLRRGTEAVESHLVLRQTSGSAVNRIDIKVDWLTRNISAITGTLVDSHWLDSDTVWIAAYGPGVVAAATNKIRCVVHTSGANCHFTGIQAENHAYPTLLVQTSGTLKSWDIILGKIVEETRYSHEDLSSGHRVITRTIYDKLGRGLRVQIKNTDSTYGGEAQFKLVQASEYKDDENAVITRSYLDENATGASFAQTKIVNDWLGRGVLRESTWPLKNGLGQEQVVEKNYDMVGKLVQVRMPSGEEYRYKYSSKGALEKVTFPDGTYELVSTDKNGRVMRRLDRRLLETLFRYNQADLQVESITPDGTFGLISRVTTHTHLGPASVSETENGIAAVASAREYHWSGAPSKATQTVDSLTLTVDYAYDAGGTLISVTPTGSGANPWSQKFNLIPQFHPSIPDTDPFNRTAIEKEGGTHLITRESDFLGLVNRIKYGDYGSTKGEVTLGYDKFLRPVSILSNEDTPALNISLTRDFSGNILSKEGNTYAYDGMNRLVEGEGEATSYDELHNLSVRGAKRYSYQDAGESGENQMRLSSFDDGSSTWEYSYDENGNISSISIRFDSLVYDSLNRLREVHFHGSARVDRYWYDVAGLRVKKDENGTKTYSLYTGEDPAVQEVYSGPTRVLTRLNIVDAGQMLARYEHTYSPVADVVKYFYLDQIGSRRVVKDSSGSVTDRFSYSAWGEATQTQGTASELANYTGKEYDGTGLLYFNARYYDPTIGRFITEDPARKGTGWYTYCENNPINLTDPTGLQPPGYVQNLLRATEKPIGFGELRAVEFQQAEQATPMFQFPVSEGRLTDIFRPGNPPKHAGIDIAPTAKGVEGDPVYAAASGRITMAGINPHSPTGSTYIKISHTGGYETDYAHTKVLVTEGEWVHAGQKIATMAAEGADSVHLHFEVRINNDYQDPLSQPGLTALPPCIKPDYE